ncbi:class I SAM-dependent methyltransferase [Aquabacterium sp. A7-Y]|uniref:class I SAM-dependent methyltransferase n=1 Tax=Aquabacterium sp. A7-Y TaxID=1349605 RepID=UPI00223D7082|nr:class I SAM-dependent methyltransferase [Aquabacterium sp. A7-Y]MCW7539422.1 class I SAM-dependent methyltransferase [Aquabacterium sp. A7-Y]
MYPQCTYRWSGLAGLWPLFERLGLSPAMAASQVSEMATPVALLGCRGGAVLETLQRELGSEQVFGFDTSPEMVLQARERGCAHVHVSDALEPLPDGQRFGTVVVSTGVLDPLEPAEARVLLAQLREHLRPGAELWLYGLGRLGPHWQAARILAATDRLGVANHRLYELHRQAGHSSVRAVLQELALSGREALVAKLWLACLERLVAAVSRAEACSREAASSLLKGLAPQVQRCFHPAELIDVAVLAGLNPAMLHAWEGPGVLRLVCRAEPAGASRAGLAFAPHCLH